MAHVHRTPLVLEMIVAAHKVACIHGCERVDTAHFLIAVVDNQDRWPSSIVANIFLKELNDRGINGNHLRTEYVKHAQHGVQVLPLDKAMELPQEEELIAVLKGRPGHHDEVMVDDVIEGILCQSAGGTTVGYRLLKRLHIDCDDITDRIVSSRTPEAITTEDGNKARLIEMVEDIENTRREVWKDTLHQALGILTDKESEWESGAMVDNAKCAADAADLVLDRFDRKFGIAPKEQVPTVGSKKRKVAGTIGGIGQGQDGMPGGAG